MNDDGHDRLVPRGAAADVGRNAMATLLASYDSIQRGIAAAADWFASHKDEIEALATWGAVQAACRRAAIYAPMNDETWAEIAAAERRGDSVEMIAAQVLTAYGPKGAAHHALRAELLSSSLLADRRTQVDEVLSSLQDGRFYVSICGALPLVEGILAAAHGRWQKRPSAYPLKERLFVAGSLSAEQEADLLLNASAVEMVLHALHTTWADTALRVGGVESELNRHRALHGTTTGWDSLENATYALLLLAAAARVAEPLLASRSSDTE